MQNVAMQTVIFAERYLCRVSHVSSKCLMSLCWVSFCWMSWSTSHIYQLALRPEKRSLSKWSNLGASGLSRKY